MTRNIPATVGFVYNLKLKLTRVVKKNRDLKGGGIIKSKSFKEDLIAKTKSSVI